MQKNRTICCVGVIFWLLCSSLFAQNGLQIPEELETALLNENWQQVANLLDTVDTQTPSPVLRLIKGHACLALNRNNESLCLFTHTFSQDSSKTASDYYLWSTWAKEFYSRNTLNPISLYLLGDSKARLDEFAEAIEIFSQGISLNAKNAFLLNARGVAYAAQGNWDFAVVDFDDALRNESRLADLYCSRGAIDVFLRTASESARANFNKALEINPECAIAYNGLGCVEYGEGHWEDSKKGFQNALKHSTCLPITMYNLEALASEWISYIEKKSDLIAEGNPGTEIDRQISSIKREASFLRTKEIAKDFAWNTVADLASTVSLKAGVRIPIADKMNARNLTSPRQLELSIGLDGSKIVDRNRPFMDNYLKSSSQPSFDRIVKLDDRVAVLEKTKARLPNLGGVTTDMKRAHIDTGDWPVDMVFGLLYIVKPDNTTD